MSDSALMALVPRRLRFEFSVAFRHLRSGGGQTLLTVSAVGAGVIIVIFITSLIFGLQDQLTELLTEAIPHVTIQVEEPEPKALAKIPGAGTQLSSSRIEQQAPQRKFIDNWPQVVNIVRSLPNVRTVARGQRSRFRLQRRKPDWRNCRRRRSCVAGPSRAGDEEFDLRQISWP